MADEKDLKPYLSIIIPVYNEESRLPASLERILGWLEEQPFPGEVVLVDDGCRDETVPRARAIFSGHRVPHRILHNSPNRGKGYSVRRGLWEAEGEYLLFTDADLSTPIEEFDKLLPSLQEGYEVAIASRGLAASEVEVHQNWFRERMGKTFNFLVRLITLPGIHDTQCGFKAFQAGPIKKVLPHLRIDGWAFDVELLFVARKMGLRIAEIPVRWRNDENTRVNAFSDSTRMFLELVSIRFRDLRGGYDKPRAEFL